MHRPVGTERWISYTYTTPLQYPWIWNTLWQRLYTGGGELGTTTHLGDTLFGRPRELSPPDQQNHHLDPPRLPDSLRVPVRRGDVSPIPFPEVSQLNPIPQLDLKRVLCGCHASPERAPPTNTTMFLVLSTLGCARLGLSSAPRPYLNNHGLRNSANVVAPQARPECPEPSQSRH